MTLIVAFPSIHPRSKPTGFTNGSHYPKNPVVFFPPILLHPIQWCFQMMSTMKSPVVVWALLFCTLFVNGFMVVPSVGHAEHHADHQRTTHSSGMCAWFCAAGEVIESASVQLNPEIQPIEQVTVASVETILPLTSFYSRLRGPPGFFS